MNKINENRRLILKGVGALGTSSILIACGGGSSDGSSANSSGGGGSGGTSSKGTSAAVCAGTSATIPLVIDASVGATGIPATVPMYAYIVGLTAYNGNTYYRYSASQKKPIVMQTSDSDQPAKTCAGMTTNGASATINCPTIWANYAIPLDRSCATLVADLASFNGTNMPGLGTGSNAFSGRIYISVGQPIIPFTPRAGVNADQLSGSPVTGYTAPALASGSVGSLCLFDWLEFSFDSNQALNINTTQVDQFGFPISMTATGTGMTGGEQGVLNTSRSSIIANLAALPSTLFNSSVAVPTNGVNADAYPSSVYTANTLRAVSPKTVASASDTYFTSTISTWYSNWSTTPVVTYDAATGYYSGMISGGVLTFKSGSFSTATAWQLASSAGSFTNTQITSYDVWQCANSLATGNGNQKNVQKMIAAAFQRGTMASANYVLNDTLGSSFSPSLSGNYANSPSNTWAQKFHQFNANGLAYGFPYDDVGSLQPTISTASGTTSLTIQVGLFA